VTDGLRLAGHLAALPMGFHTREASGAIKSVMGAGVEFVRGMPAVKVFGLTVKSFGAFHETIQGYKRFVLSDPAVP
jgi:hypothetical protein